MSDLLRFLGEEEAMKAMAILEGSSDSDRISKKDLKNWVVSTLTTYSYSSPYLFDAISNIFAFR